MFGLNHQSLAAYNLDNVCHTLDQGLWGILGSLHAHACCRTGDLLTLLTSETSLQNFILSKRRRSGMHDGWDGQWASVHFLFTRNRLFPLFVGIIVLNALSCYFFVFRV